MILDPWQNRVLETKGNIALRAGRQVGKSTIISIKAAEFATHNPLTNVLVISAVERQALLLFEKTLAYLHQNYRTFIKKGKDKPTKHKISLTNGTTIYCLPTGLSGYGIRGYTIHLLIADEAAFIPEEVWTAVTPMLAITKGSIILISTPFGKGNYFYKCFNDPTFTTFHVSAEDSPRKNQQFLDEEKKRMSVLQYTQEYLGEFIDKLRQFFPTDLIKSVMTLQKVTPIETFFPSGDHYLGVDVAQMGKDETVLFTVLKSDREHLKEVQKQITIRTRLTETIKNIKIADKKYNYKNIYIDTGGLGVGVFDPLLQDEQTKRKVIPINNATRSLDNEDAKRIKLLKEDLYTNLLTLMERGQIQLVEDEDTMLSLKSVQAEYEDGKLKIFGEYTHITEALIRAAWCMNSKKLNIWIS